MESIIINRKTPEDFTLDDIIELNYRLANENLDFIQENIKKAKKSTKQDVMDFIKDVRPDKNDIVIGDTTIEWKIKPGIKLGKLADGQVIESLEKTKIHVKISNNPTEDTEIFCVIDSQPFKINKDGTFGTIDINIGGTLKF